MVVRQITNSSFNVPILIDRDNNLIAGYGRLLACRERGWSDVLPSESAAFGAGIDPDLPAGPHGHPSQRHVLTKEIPVLHLVAGNDGTPATSQATT